MLLLSLGLQFFFILIGFILKENYYRRCGVLEYEGGCVLFLAGVMKTLKMKLSHSEQILITFPQTSTVTQHLHSSSGLFETSAVENAFHWSQTGNHNMYSSTQLTGHMSNLNSFRPITLLYVLSSVPVSSPSASCRLKCVSTKLSLWVPISIWICFHL